MVTLTVILLKALRYLGYHYTRPCHLIIGRGLDMKVLKECGHFVWRAGVRLAHDVFERACEIGMVVGELEQVHMVVLGYMGLADLVDLRYHQHSLLNDRG